MLRYELTGEENHKAEACLKRIQAYLDFAFITKDGDNSGITTMSLIDALSYVKEWKDEVCPLETMCRSLVQKAAERGDIRFVKALYNSYKDRIVYEEEVQTALMYAAHNGHADVVQYLVPYEAGCRDCYGETALMYAVEGGHERCVEILLNTRDVGQINSDGKTALMLAIEKGCSEKIVRLLSAVEGKK